MDGVEGLEVYFLIQSQPILQFFIRKKAFASFLFILFYLYLVICVLVVVEGILDVDPKGADGLHEGARDTLMLTKDFIYHSGLGGKRAKVLKDDRDRVHDGVIAVVEELSQFVLVAVLHGPAQTIEPYDGLRCFLLSVRTRLEEVSRVSKGVDGLRGGHAKLVYQGHLAVHTGGYRRGRAGHGSDAGGTTGSRHGW
jgi:hypothetical protein